MISGNPIHPQNGLGAAQDDPVSSGSGSWYGRTIKVLKAVPCFVSGVVAVATLATGFYAVAAVSGVIFVVSGLYLLSGKGYNAVDLSEPSSQSLSDVGDDESDICDEEEGVYHTGTDESEFHRNIFSHYPVYRNAPAPVTKMSSETVSVSPNNGLRLDSADLVVCKSSLESGYSAVDLALNQMWLHSLKPRCSSILRKNLDILKTKEPFDEEIFLETAELLRVNQSVIDGHQRLDKSKKIQLLEDMYRQQKEVPELHRKHAESQIASLKTIKHNFESYAPGDRLSRLPDSVPEIEIATMKEHVDALDTLLSSINRCSLGLLIQVDDDLQGKMSKAAEAVQKCRNILNGTD